MAKRKCGGRAERRSAPADETGDRDVIRLYGNAEQKKILSPWPTPEPPDYLPWLNHSQAKEEVENIRYAITRSRPYGSEKWVSKAVAQFGLETEEPVAPRERHPFSSDTWKGYLTPFSPPFSPLVGSPKDWPWSSCRFYYLEDASILRMDRMG